MILVGYVARLRNGRNRYKILVRKLGRRKPLEKPRQRWESTTKM
jgi:hypothetical protein